ncbi:MAG: hypothetical protein H6672_20730 [Anaerolineaceae bacterium]|nr:hypothetical protein [Anaerolineaceae bacterium]
MGDARTIQPLMDIMANTDLGSGMRDAVTRALKRLGELAPHHLWMLRHENQVPGVSR